MEKRKLILFIAMSIDGYIAKEDGDISWLSMAETPGEDYGYSNIVAQTDTLIMGRKTYDKVLTLADHFPHDDRQVYIITRSEKASEGAVHFYNEGAKNLITSLREKQGKHIHLDGGGEVVHAFMKENLIDEYIISIIPILLGAGIPLFKQGNKPELSLRLTSCTHFPSGLVQLHYHR